MTKCFFVYENAHMYGMELQSQVQQLRCNVHNCTIPVTFDYCVLGKFEALEERIAKLEAKDEI